MKQNFYKPTLLLWLCLPFMAAANTGIFSREKVERTIHKTFEVNPDALLDIDNSFGDVNIVTWDQNQITIDIKITVSGRSQKKITERLETISIQFQNNPNRVSAYTQIEEQWQWSWFGSYQQADFKIDYDIKMPSSNALEISNDYGIIILDQIDGDTAISCDYGKVILGELRGNQNILSFDYTANSSIDYVKNAIINADYSGFELGVAEKLELNADYTNSKIEKVGDLNFNTDYGKLTVNKARKVMGNGDYITLRFGAVSELMEVETDYGTIRVNHIQPSAQKIQIDSDYTTIRLGVSPQWDFDFNIDLEYAGFQSELPLTYRKEIRDDSDRFFEGYHSNPSSTHTLVIKADYGSLKILTPFE